MARKHSAKPEEENNPVLATRVWQFIETEFQALLNPVRKLAEELPVLLACVSENQKENLQVVLDSYQGARKSYRIALVVQFAFGICSDTRIDLAKRQPGARGNVAKRLGKLLAKAHIASVNDAYENIGKNTTNLARGNFRESDAILHWASGKARTKNDLRAVFTYACAHIASTARPVLPMPEIDQGKLTFAAVLSLLADMLSVKSRGVHEQFITACLLYAKVEQTNVLGHRTERVETKKITASDESSSTAGDIQIKSGTRIIDAFEVTANSWEEKIDGAKPTIRAHDLSRLHIVATVEKSDEMLADLRGRDEDISVLDLRSLVPVLLADLTKPSRAVALKRLYDYLDRSQGEPQLVNDYVQKLVKHGLANG